MESLNFSAYTDKWSFCGGRKVSLDHIVWKEQTTKTKMESDRPPLYVENAKIPVETVSSRLATISTNN